MIPIPLPSFLRLLVSSNRFRFCGVVHKKASRLQYFRGQPDRAIKEVEETAKDVQSKFGPAADETLGYMCLLALTYRDVQYWKESETR
jgi:hypothetical protein